MSDLTPDVVALLTAARDALDLPLGATAEDGQVRAQLLHRRASDTVIILTAVLQGHPMPGCADQLTGWTAKRPVTYQPWVRATPADDTTDGTTDA